MVLFVVVKVVGAPGQLLVRCFEGEEALALREPSLCACVRVCACQ